MLQGQCKKCGFLNPSTHKHCGQCGASITQETTSPKSRSVKPSNNATGIGCLAVIILGVIITFLNSGKKSESVSGSPTQSRPEARINARVQFSGSQFVISNLDPFPWRDVKMEINGGVFSGGYELRHPVIEANQVYTVGAMQFANGDGVRFNPFQMKPKKFSICATTPNGLACYVGEWD